MIERKSPVPSAFCWPHGCRASRVTIPIRQEAYPRHMNALARLIRPARAAVPMQHKPIDITFEPEHALAEQSLRALRQRRKAAEEQLAAPVSIAVGTTPEMREAADELHALDREIKRAKEALAPHRVKHLKRVRQAVRDPMRAAARRALEAIAEVEAALGEVNALRSLVRTAGGEAPDIAGKPMIYVALPLRYITGDAK